MSELKICRICLRTEAKGYKYELFQLKYYYEEVTAVKVNEQEGLPQWFCYECAATLYKFHKFKEKCYIGYKLLRDMIMKGPLTYEAIYKIARPSELITSTIVPLLITHHINYNTNNDINLQNNDINNVINDKNNINNDIMNSTNDKKLNNDMINIFDLDDVINDMKHYNDNGININNDCNDVIEQIDEKNTNDELVEASETILYQIDEQNTNDEYVKASETILYQIDEQNTNDEHEKASETKYKPKSEASKSDVNEQLPPKIITIDSHNKIIELHEENVVKTKDINTHDLKKNLNMNNWKRTDLSEEDAIKEFRAKAEDVKYLNSPYKCMDCFKGFSKIDMMKRHKILRHSDSLGDKECRVCRMRFKWKSHLRRHMSQHYTRFECLKCHLVFNLETSAILHDQYHSGETKKCLYCDEQFKHVTTYYTHLRSHRSSHVCRHCGEAFVSEAGLHQHRRRKHMHDDMESHSDDDDTHRHCDKCDMTFDGLKAYQEHLFHSAEHCEIQRNNKDEELGINNSTKKILGKKIQESITRELRKCSSDVTSPSSTKKKSKRQPKRIYKKPTKCHQCGIEFPTQRACLSHHLKQHPRTSFFSNADRHICELCGASLAPGSVAVHMNMHTQRTLHACDSCGKRFHSAVGLKRHTLTHTGEKPYACPLCEKRFTQSNSMKLHYRTFHLKQPYPQRSKRLKSSSKHRKRETTDTDSSARYSNGQHATDEIHYLTLN